MYIFIIGQKEMINSNFSYTKVKSGVSPQLQWNCVGLALVRLRTEHGFQLTHYTTVITCGLKCDFSCQPPLTHS